MPNKLFEPMLEVFRIPMTEVKLNQIIHDFLSLPERDQFNIISFFVLLSSKRPDMLAKTLRIKRAVDAENRRPVNRLEC